LTMPESYCFTITEGETTARAESKLPFGLKFSEDDYGSYLQEFTHVAADGTLPHKKLPWSPHDYKAKFSVDGGSTVIPVSTHLGEDSELFELLSCDGFGGEGKWRISKITLKEPASWVDRYTFTTDKGYDKIWIDLVKE
jgi:hypothetical protein